VEVLGLQNSADVTEAFSGAIAPFLLTYQSIGVRTILDLAEGQVLSLVACLSSESPVPLEEVQPIVRDILFVKGALPLSELNSLLDGWINGSIQIQNRAFTTSVFSQRQFMELTKPWDDLTSGWPELSDYRHLLLYAIGPDISELTKPRNLEALATALGFRSFPEMSEHRVQFRVGQSRYTRMEIFAPILATIEATSTMKEIHFKISAHAAMSLSDMHMSYRLQDDRGNRIAGAQLGLTEFSSAPTGDLNILQYDLPVPEEVRSGEVNLFHSHYHQGIEPVMTKLFAPPPIPGKTNPHWDLIMSLVSNTRAFIGKRTDPEEVIKEDWLGLGSKRVSEEFFSRGMSCLLFAAGFTKLSMGSEAEGVDEAIQITEPEQLAILLSYTTGPNVGEKARKLNVQVERLQKRLQNYNVCAAIVIPLDEGELFVRDLEECKKENINLILRSELEQMFQAVRGIEWPRAREVFIHLLTSKRLQLF
jgi:hypothetical protein